MEIWDAYLADGTLAGRDLVRGKPIPKELYHLVSEILVRHTDGDYLLMQTNLFSAVRNPFRTQLCAECVYVSSEIRDLQKKSPLFDLNCPSLCGQHKKAPM